MDTSETNALVDLISSRGGEASVRQLQRWSRKYRPSSDLARAALESLAAAGLGSLDGDTLTLSPDLQTSQDPLLSKSNVCPLTIQPAIPTPSQGVVQKDMHHNEGDTNSGNVAAADGTPPGDVVVVDPTAPVRDRWGKIIRWPKPDPPPVAEVAQVAVDPPPVAAGDSPEPSSGQVVGLAAIPPSWPEMPPNASLASEVSWVQASRLDVVEQLPGGYRVDLSRACRPAPSRAALSWLETAISYPSKFADVAVKAAQGQSDEQEEVKRERLAVEEIRRLLAEMLDEPAAG